jgi:hypothetical protein
VNIYVTDPDNTPQQLRVAGMWSVAGVSGSFGLKFFRDLGNGIWQFQGSLGPLAVYPRAESTIVVDVTVLDPAGRSAANKTSLTLVVVCIG